MKKTYRILYLKISCFSISSLYTNISKLLIKLKMFRIDFFSFRFVQNAVIRVHFVHHIFCRRGLIPAAASLKLRKAHGKGKSSPERGIEGNGLINHKFLCTWRCYSHFINLYMWIHEKMRAGSYEHMCRIDICKFIYYI